MCFVGMCSHVGTGATGHEKLVLVLSFGGEGVCVLPGITMPDTSHKHMHLCRMCFLLLSDKQHEW